MSALDENAIQVLVDDEFSKETISDTVLNFSPTVPNKEEVYGMIENCTHQAAAFNLEFDKIAQLAAENSRLKVAERIIQDFKFISQLFLTSCKRNRNL